jgi:hypothetical protein
MGLHDTAGLTIVAICGSLGPTLAVVVSHVLSQRGIKCIAAVTESTHVIVNSQRSVMLRLVASLSRRIADENPGDIMAQRAADGADSHASGR